ncbi:MAG: hypothetical protein P8Y80_05885 [Acidobacteriota bacterium]|jgi:hypothetical protein
MRATFGFIGILMVLGIGYFIYSSQIQSGPNDEPLPQQTNLIAVRQGLLSLGQSERFYMATNGTYASLEQLRSSGIAGNLPNGNGWGYEYSIEVNGAEHFLITARPVDSGSDLPVMSIDETMQVQ